MGYPTKEEIEALKKANEEKYRMSEDERVKSFINDLAQLTIKYGVDISGCGCCGSPSVYALIHPVSENGYYTTKDGHEHLEWING